MAMDFSQYKFKPLDDDQANEAAEIMATGLGLGMPTGKQSMTWGDYQNWWLAALNDGKLKRKEWRDLGDMAGFRGKDARKAFKKGGAYWQKYLNETIKPKLQKNSYIYRDPTTGKVSLISQGDMNYDPEAYANAYYKGTDSTKLANDFNKALADARKNAKITYKQGKDGKWGYFTSYKVGDFAVDDLNVSNSDWFKTDADRQKNAQLLAYKDAVDKSYADNRSLDYISDDGLKLLQKIGYKNIDEVKNYSNLKDTDEDKTKKDTIRQNVSSALQKYFDTMAKNSKGEYSWNESAKADATWKHLMDYYNGKNIAWLGQLDWRDKSRYSDAINITPETTMDTSGVAGSLIGLHKEGGNLKARVMAKGGMIPKAGWGTTLLGDGWLGQGADLATDFVPFAGTANRIYDGTLKTPGEIALSLGLDALGPAAKGLRVLGRAVKIARGANKATKTATAAAKAATKAEKAFDKVARSSAFKKEYEIYLKAQKAVETAATPENVQNLQKATKALHSKMKKIPAAQKYLEQLTSTRNALADAQAASKNATKLSTKEALSLANATTGSTGKWQNGAGWIFGPNAKTVVVGMLGRGAAHNYAKASSLTPQQPTEEAAQAVQQAKPQAAQQASGSLQPGDPYVDEAGNTNVVNPDGATSVVAGDEYNSATYRVINKQGGILKSLDNKYFKKGGKLKSKYGIIKNS